MKPVADTDMTRIASLLLFLLVPSVSIPSPAEEASVAADRDVENLFGTAVALAREDNCAAAIPLLEEVIRRGPFATAFFNLGMCYYQAEREADTYAVLSALVERYDEDRWKQQHDKVREILDYLGSKFGRIAVRTDPEEAEIWLDGERVARRPIIGSLGLTPGGHTVRVDMEGYVPIEKEIEVVAGAPLLVVHIVLVALTPEEDPDASGEGPVPPTTVEPTRTPEASEMPAAETFDTESNSPAEDVEPSPHSRGLLIGGLALSGLGAAGLAVGTAFNVKGSKDKARLRDASDGSEAVFSELYQDTLPTDQAMTIVGYSVGGTLLAVGAGLSLAHWLRHRRQEDRGERRGSLSVDGNGIQVVF